MPERSSAKKHDENKRLDLLPVFVPENVPDPVGFQKVLLDTKLRISLPRSGDNSNTTTKTVGPIKMKTCGLCDSSMNGLKKATLAVVSDLQSWLRTLYSKSLQWRKLCLQDTLLLLASIS